MFQFVTKIFKTVWGEDEEENDDFHEKDIQGIGTSIDDPSTSAAVTHDNKSENSRIFTGYITSLHNDYGLVDHQVYFSFNLCKGVVVPKVGTKVRVTAQRKHGDSGWSAVSLVPAVDDSGENWDEVPTDQGGVAAAVASPSPTPSRTTDSLVALVTDVNGNLACLNENLTFDECRVEGVNDFTPCKGDWVTATTQVDPVSGECRVVKVLPLRTWDFEGEVNSVQQGFGYINSDIYFSFGVCLEGYTPQRRDRVRGRAIECSRGRCPWRAVQVIPVHESPPSTTSPKAPTLHSPTNTLLANKENVKITGNLDFGEMHTGEKKTIKAFIRNENPQSQTLLSCRFVGDEHGQFCVQKVDFVPPNKEIDPGIAVLIPPGKEAVVYLTFKASNLGADKKLLVFEFTTFKIGRYVQVCVRDGSYHSILNPSAPYQRRAGINRFRQTQEGADGEGWLVPGQRPNRSKLAIKLPNRLPQFPVPKSLESAYLNHENVERVAPSLGEELCIKNYTQRFSALLHMEEIQETIDIRQFDLHRVTLRHYGEYLALVVPGLAEGRPSVLVSDSVILTPPGLYDNEPEYQGYVHEVLSTEVLLKFHTDFHNQYNGEDYNVRFTFNRMPMRRCHQAVTFAPSLGSEVLFPNKLIPKVPQTKVAQRAGTLGMVGDVVKASPVSGIKQGPRRRPKYQAQNHVFFNVRLNARQRAAVLRILSGQGRPTPYVLFGPPGTGKTVTLVEALLQVLHHIPASRVIACTPSNSAADLLTERLHLSGRIKPSDIARLNSYSRKEESIPAVIKPYCHTGDDLELVSRHRVVICTCTSAGMMYSLGLRPGHFTHVFIDEAGQATEPECLCPVGLVAGADGQIVLAGDPLQLGPVLQSRPAKDYGLGVSFLERLIKSNLYERNEKKFADHGSYDPLLVTKLVENYRSHEALLKLPSLLFYHNELLASADHALTDSLTDWEKLANKNNFPLLFHGIRGEDMREGNSPSWFNPMEALQVMRYLQSLSGESGLSLDDIGIITPYRKQVEKIRLLIDKLGMDRVKVGSVEEFQGQERLVMIISTVRSSEGEVKSDVIHNLGFLSNPKRFNVAISRAQALMVVIGNPHVLAQDENWKILIKYCVQNGAYVGSDLPDLNLAEEVNLDPIQRTSTPTDPPPDTLQDLVSAAPGPSALEALSQETETVGSRWPEGLTSESDGDETLSVNSADTEINVLLTARPKACPGRGAGLPQAGDEQLENDSISTESAKTCVPEEPCHRGDSKKTEHSANNEIKSATSLESSHIQTCITAESSPGTMSQQGAVLPEGRGHSLTSQHNYTGKTCDTDRSEITSETPPKTESKKIDFKEPTCASTPYVVQRNRTHSPTKEQLKKPAKEDSVSCSSPTNPTQQVHQAGRCKPCSPSPDGAKRPSRGPRARRNTAERLFSSVNTSNTRTPKTPTSPSTPPTPAETTSPSTFPTPVEPTSPSTPPTPAEPTRPSTPPTQAEPTSTSIPLTKAEPIRPSTPPTPAEPTSTSIPSTKAEPTSLSIPPTSAEPTRPSTPTTQAEPSCGDWVAGVDEASRLDVNLNFSIGESDASSSLSNSFETSCSDVVNIDHTDNASSYVKEKTLDSVPFGLRDRRIPFDVVLNNTVDSASVNSTERTVSDSDLPSIIRIAHLPHYTQNQSIVSSHVNKESEKGGETLLDLGKQVDDIAQDAHECSDVNGNTDDGLPMTELERKIVRQIEHYFGTFNMSKDRFMQDLVKQDSGWVKLEMLVSFNRLRALSTDFGVITRALRKSVSGLLEVDDELQRVRRCTSNPLPVDYDEWKSGLKDRSLFVIGLKTETMQDELTEFFGQWGVVEHIHLLPTQRRYQDEGVVYRYPFVLIYKNPSDAKALLNSKRRLGFDDSMLYVHAREDVLDMLFKPKNHRKQKFSGRKTDRPAEGDNTNPPMTVNPQPQSPGQGAFSGRGRGLLGANCLPTSPRPGPGVIPPDHRGELPRPPQHRGRSRGFPVTLQEPNVGGYRQQEPVVGPVLPAVTPVWTGRGRGRGVGHTPPVRVDCSSPPGGLDSRDNSLEQDDSDVIIESSEEEFL